MSNLAVELAESFDFECTGADDHDSPVCRKCGRLRTALIALLRRVGEGSQAAPNLNAEMLASDAISMILERHNTTFKDDVALNDVRAIITHFIERAAAGSGTFADGIEAAAKYMDDWHSDADLPFAGDCIRTHFKLERVNAKIVEAVNKSHKSWVEKGWVAPAPDKSGEK